MTNFLIDNGYKTILPPTLDHEQFGPHQSEAVRQKLLHGPLNARFKVKRVEYLASLTVESAI